MLQRRDVPRIMRGCLPGWKAVSRRHDSQDCFNGSASLAGFTNRFLHAVAKMARSL